MGLWAQMQAHGAVDRAQRAAGQRYAVALGDGNRHQRSMAKAEHQFITKNRDAIVGHMVKGMSIGEAINRSKRHSGLANAVKNAQFESKHHRTHGRFA